MKIVFGPQFNEDLRTIWEYIAQDSPEAADRVCHSVRATIALLADFPEMGPACRNLPSDLEGVRQISVKHYSNYQIFYLAAPDAVRVLRIFHGARDFAALFEQE